MPKDPTKMNLYTPTETDLSTPPDRLTAQQCRHSLDPQNDPPKMCGTCAKRPTCKDLCPELASWLDKTYRDHYSVDTPEEHHWPAAIDVDDRFRNMTSSRRDNETT